MKICSVKDCNEKHMAKGLCQKHYDRQYKEDNKEHIAKRDKQYQQKNKEKISEQRKQYRQINKEHIKKHDKQYRKDNKEHCAEYQKQYRQDHKEEIAEYDKQRYQDNKEKVKKYAQDNKESIARQKKRYNQDNKEHLAEKHRQWKQTPAGKASKKANEHNHRALEKGLTLAMVQQVYEANIAKYGVLTCYLCFKPIVNNDDSLDHSTPLTRDGTNDYDNLGVAHLICNQRKHTKTLEEWNQLQTNFNNIGR